MECSDYTRRGGLREGGIARYEEVGVRRACQPEQIVVAGVWRAVVDIRVPALERRLGSDACYREWAYVAVSRARAGTRLYLVGDPDELGAGFTAAVQTSRAHELANEHGDAASAAPDPRIPAMHTVVQRRLALVGHAIRANPRGAPARPAAPHRCQVPP